MCGPMGICEACQARSLDGCATVVSAAVWLQVSGGVKDGRCSKEEGAEVFVPA